VAVLVVGSIGLDTIETPYGVAEETLGGSAAYFSLAARHFTDVQLVAVVGDDFPAGARALLEGQGIDLSGLESHPGRTFRWRGAYGRDLTYAETRATELNVFASFHPRLSPAHRRARTVFLANIDPDLQLEVLSQVESPSLVACDTMNYWISSKRDRLLEVLRRVDVCLINDEEAKMLAGEAQLPRAARWMLDAGVRRVVVKKGEHGALFFSREESFYCPAVPHERLVDPTGAGDSFAGGFLGYLDRMSVLEPPPFRQAMVCGAAIASLCVESFSPRRLVETTREEIADRVRAVRALGAVPEIDLGD
jgi:sugar/nucleoside kinase (ribokinase family)